MIAIFRTLAPSAVTPPSANMKHCRTSTAVITITAAPGPSRTTARTAPVMWPEVPAAIGKFSICVANTNAAARPISGTRRGDRLRRTSRRPSAIPATAAAPAAIAVGRSRKPSGMCMFLAQRHSMRSVPVVHTSDANRYANRCFPQAPVVSSCGRGHPAAWVRPPASRVCTAPAGRRRWHRDSPAPPAVPGTTRQRRRRGVAPRRGCG